MAISNSRAWFPRMTSFIFRSMWAMCRGLFSSRWSMSRSISDIARRRGVAEIGHGGILVRLGHRSRRIRDALDHRGNG